VTVAEWAVLRALYDEAPMPPSQLAAWMGMSRGAVSKLADRLIAKDLIVRVADPDDGRGQTLGLTKVGSALVPRLAKLADRNDAECFAHLSHREREALRRILQNTVTRLGITAPAID
jgi:DNA-binding MarR family transcriptional regulator